MSSRTRAARVHTAPAATTGAPAAPPAAPATKSRKRKAGEVEAVPAAKAAKAADEAEMAEAAASAVKPTKKATSSKKKSTVSPRPPAAATATADGPVWKHGTTSREMEALRLAGKTILVGVDEAGRGPLAGPVVAAAAYIPPHVHFEGVNDSKKLDERQRELLYGQLTSQADIVYAVCVLDHQVVDRINILEATLLAMQTCVDDVARQLKARNLPAIQHVLVDGNRLPKTMAPGQQSYTSEWVIKGDGLVYSIAAASIIAKVHRDRLMHEYDAQWPQYGFTSHRGYGCASHMAAIHRHGPCPIHRMTFAPMKHMKPRKTKTDDAAIDDEKDTSEGTEKPIAKPRTSRNSKRAAAAAADGGQEAPSIVTGAGETASTALEKPAAAKKAKKRSTKKA